MSDDVFDDHPGVSDDVCDDVCVMNILGVSDDVFDDHSGVNAGQNLFTRESST